MGSVSRCRVAIGVCAVLGVGIFVRVPASAARRARKAPAKPAARAKVVKKAPAKQAAAKPARMPDGQYKVLGLTTYSPPTGDISLVWLRSMTDGKRYLVELDAKTECTGEGVSDAVAGPEMVRPYLTNDTVIGLTLSTRKPTVDKYGDPTSPNVINGVAKLIKVTKPAGEADGGSE